MKEFPKTDKTCQPRNTIVFHKTHKCSSTTIQNILLRYGFKNKLNIALPYKGNFLGSPNGFTASSLNNTHWYQAGMTPQLFCLHNRWNAKEVQKLMDKNEEKPFYFTILRDPVEIFISMWDYYEVSRKLFDDKLNIETFALNIETSDYNMTLLDVHLRNTMLYDFGMAIEDLEIEQKVEEKIKEIEGVFDLVLMVEHFDVSMVLLKNELCWPNYEDLVSLKLNVRDDHSKSSVSEKAREKLKSWLSSDYKLYYHFYHKFLQKVKHFGTVEQLQSELQDYQKLQLLTKEKCQLRYLKSKYVLDKIDRPWGAGIKPYTVVNPDKDCQLMGMQELKFIKYMRILQTQKARDIMETNHVSYVTSRNTDTTKG